MLERLGVKPRTVRRFKTIDGRILERKVGEIIIECMEDITTVDRSAFVITER